MQWWNDFLTWLGSDAGWRILTTAVFPFIAIVVAGIIAALIGRGATRRLISHQDRELQAAAVAAMIDAGRSATMWSSLSSGAQSHSDSQFNAADLRVRLLPLAGATAAADWSTHEIRAMRRDSAGFSFQAEQTYADYRDRLLEWQRRPGRARKLFALDLERFRFEDSSADNELVEQQRRWAAQQAAAEQAAVVADESAAATPTVASTPSAATSAAPIASPVATPIAVPQPVVEPIIAPIAEPASELLPAVESSPESNPTEERDSDTNGEPDTATQAYAMPVAASSHVNEQGDRDIDDDDDAPEEQQPHVESEEDPDHELPGVEIAEPVEHDEPESYETGAADSADSDSDSNSAVNDAADDEDSETSRNEWEGQPTQALPLIEPPIEPQSPYAPAGNNDENRSH